ncbi:uncharacterized protein [Hemitrygon akajei]|uniref:uncharacterized protein n=1 Tax=Hemitrygon akajei TaxID=2704970 RepID=UPI003BF9E229
MTIFPDRHNAGTPGINNRRTWYRFILHSRVFKLAYRFPVRHNSRTQAIVDWRPRTGLDHHPSRVCECSPGDFNTGTVCRIVYWRAHTGTVLCPSGRHILRFPVRHNAGTPGINNRRTWYRFILHSRVFKLAYRFPVRHNSGTQGISDWRPRTGFDHLPSRVCECRPGDFNTGTVYRIVYRRAHPGTVLCPSGRHILRPGDFNTGTVCRIVYWRTHPGTVLCPSGRYILRPGDFNTGSVYRIVYWRAHPGTVLCPSGRHILR